MGKSTISTGPFSSSQTVNIYQAGYVINWEFWWVQKKNFDGDVAMDQYLLIIMKIPFLVGYSHPINTYENTIFSGMNIQSIPMKIPFLVGWTSNQYLWKYHF